MIMNEPIQGGETLDVAAGRRVHLMMWDRKITQVELGRTVGMDQSSLGKRLRGERGWSLDQLASVAGALETTIAYLVGETDDPKPQIPRAGGAAGAIRSIYFLEDGWARRGSNPRPADYRGAGSMTNRITFADFTKRQPEVMTLPDLAEIISIEEAPRYREKVGT
jgi:transcriptional regulator with XRE-family HTH domain